MASAINDLVLARGAGTQLLLDVCVDGDLYVRLTGDGIVVATPLGSSAYSMAAGGSLLASGDRGVRLHAVGDAWRLRAAACGPRRCRGHTRGPSGPQRVSLASDWFAAATEAQRFAITSSAHPRRLRRLPDRPS
ncbi:MAG: hypothetical protein ACXVHX_37050 [Solirubrobacteraceae bacterium]